MVNLKNFQLEDYSRAALHDGSIIAHDAGLGKSFSAMCFSMLKLGVDIGEYLALKGSCLLVAPGELHKQFIDEIGDIFCQRFVSIDSQETFLKYTKLDPQTGRRTIPNGFYITTYEQLGRNGVDKPAEEDVSIGMEKNGFRCVYSPCLADLAADTFDCVVVDEATKMKGDYSAIGMGVRIMRPKYRLVMTATPIKNRLQDIFWLCHWACGGHASATSRWPYNPTAEDKGAFADEFQVAEDNLTKAEKARRETGKRKRFKKLTPQVTSVHKIWKLMAPIVLRRRKEDCGEDIVKMNKRVVRVPMGKEQSKVYEYHLKGEYLDINEKPALGAKFQALRQIATDPTTMNLRAVKSDCGHATFKSDNAFTPKMASCLNLVSDIVKRGEQVVVFSAFNDSLDTVSRFLNDAGVKNMVLDGRTNNKVRGIHSATFKKGNEIPVILAGEESMAEGHSWHTCRNAIVFSYVYAMDKIEQAINRIHRINSPEDVNTFFLVADGSIDRRLEQLYDEKSNAAELVLDGGLRNQQVDEISVAELLMIAADEFSKNDTSKLVDEDILKESWPNLKQKLGQAYEEWCRIKMVAPSHVAQL